MTLHLPPHSIDGCDFKESRLSNKIIRNMFNNISNPVVVYRNSISYNLSKDTIFRTKYLTFPLSHKIKEIKKMLVGYIHSVNIYYFDLDLILINVYFVMILKPQIICFFHCMYVDALYS